MNGQHTPNAFPQLFSSLDEGGIQSEASQQLSDLYAHLEEHGGKGKLTITISVEKGKKAGLFLFDADSTVKIPKVKKDSTFLYVNGDASVTKEDPQQAQLALKTVSLKQEQAKVIEREQAAPARAVGQ